VPGDGTRVLLHVGCHKTGTTFLQRDVFSRYAPVLARDHDPAYKAVADLIITAPDGDYRPDAARAVFDAHRHHSPMVVSDEGLSGSIWHEPADRIRTADRLHDLLPEAHVLVCVRDQRAFLTSSYSTMVKKGGYVSFSRLLDDRVPHRPVYLDHLRWDSLVEAYQRRFGPDAVTVLPYELLRQDPDSYLRQISALVAPAAEPARLREHEVRNPSLTTGWLDVLRVSNRFLRRSHYNPRSPFAVKPPGRIRGMVERADARLPLGTRGAISRSAQRRLEQMLPRFAESNARLEALTGLSLRRYGYPLP
jgi:hypothetical protein